MASYKRHLMSIAEVRNQFSFATIKNEKVKDFVREYCWNSRRTFIRLIRLARLAEISAPDIVLANELKMLVQALEEADFRKKDSLFVVKFLNKEYPKLRGILYRVRRNKA